MKLKQQATPVALASIVTSDSTDIYHGNVSLQGTFLNEKMFVLANQHYRGQLGVEVIMPVQREDINELVLVSRGWVPAPLKIDSTFMQALKIDGAHLLSASVHADVGLSFFTESALQANHWPVRLHHINIEHLSQLFDKPVFPYLLRLHNDSPAVLQRNHQMKLLNPAMNTSYARQWFGMSILLLIVSLLASSNIISILRNNHSK
ncbi:MAG: surfeit locus 1 family protein [Gammaproteobacteria bacterium]|jgi:surfeit locus 1 family protein